MALQLFKQTKELNDIDVEKVVDLRLLLKFIKPKNMKKEEYKITFTKDGYTQKVVNISAELDGWYIGNIMLGGIIGMLIVDPASGAMYKIAKEDRVINETLQPTNEQALQVYDINNLPDDISKEDLVRIS